MATSSKIITLSNKLKSAKPSEKLNRSSSKKSLVEATIIEERLQGLLNASKIYSVKTVKSAVYLIVKNLVKKGQNIVTINSVALFKNEILRNRLGIEVRLTEDESINSLEDLVDNNTGLIFLESLGILNHIIPDFQKVIAFAQSKNIPVVIDNTIGLAGNIFNPISWGADFSIEDFSSWNDSAGPHNAILVEKKGTAFPTDRDFSNRNKLRFEKSRSGLEDLPLNMKKVSGATATTANWLKETSHIKKVNFVGLSDHSSHLNALKYFTSGYGNVISFSLWANYRSFDFFLDNLIPRSFNLFKINDINYEQKKVTISIVEQDFQKIVAHFQNTFELLQKYLGSDYFLYENLYETQDAIG